MNSLARVSGFYSLQHYGYLLQQGISGSSQLGNAKHMHEFYEIIFIEKGVCCHWFEGEKQELNANDIVIVRPYQNHYYCSYSSDVVVYILSVEASEFEAFMYAYGVKSSDFTVFSVDSDQKNSIVAACEKVFISDIVKKKIMYKLLLGEFMGDFIARTPLDDKVPKNFMDAVNRMHSIENISEGLPALQRLSGYSSAQLVRLMKKFFNTTPQKYIYTLRMNTAYELVKNTGSDFDSIAETVGYSSLSHFCQTFKNHFNVTPSALRKSSQKQEKVKTTRKSHKDKAK